MHFYTKLQNTDKLFHSFLAKSIYIEFQNYSVVQKIHILSLVQQHISRCRYISCSLPRGHNGTRMNCYTNQYAKHTSSCADHSSGAHPFVILNVTNVFQVNSYTLVPFILCSYSPGGGWRSPTFKTNLQVTEISLPGKNWLLWKVDSIVLPPIEVSILPEPCILQPPPSPPNLQKFPNLELATLQSCHVSFITRSEKYNPVPLFKCIIPISRPTKA